MGQIWAVYFSATGTTQRIVTAIADHLAGGTALRYDFTPPQVRTAAASFEGFGS